MGGAYPRPREPSGPTSLLRNGPILPALRRPLDLHEGAPAVRLDALPSVGVPDGGPARPNPGQAVGRANVLGTPITSVGARNAKRPSAGHAHVTERPELASVVPPALRRSATVRAGRPPKRGRFAVREEPRVEVPSGRGKGVAARRLPPSTTPLNAAALPSAPAPIREAPNACRPSAGVLDPAPSGWTDGRDTGT